MGFFNSKLSFVDRSAIGRSIDRDRSINGSIDDDTTIFSKNRLRRRDFFGPKIVKIGAILGIFRPFENFGRLDF